MAPQKIAIVSAKAARDLDDDMPHVLEAFRQRGVDIAIAEWDDPNLDWSEFKIALLRSTWDYSQRLSEFLDWATRAATQTHLQNPLAIIRWNTDKHYLHDLEKAGVAT